MPFKSTHLRVKCGEEKFFDMLECGIARSPDGDGDTEIYRPRMVACRFDSGAGACT